MEKVFTVRADYEDFYFSETFFFKVFSSEESARKALKEQIQHVKTEILEENGDEFSDGTYEELEDSFSFRIENKYSYEVWLSEEEVQK